MLLDLLLLALIALLTGLPVLQIRKAMRNWNRLLEDAGEHAWRTACGGLNEADA